MKKVLLLLIVGLVFLGFVQRPPKLFSKGRFFSAELSSSDIAIETAFRDKQSNIQVGGSGEVIRILPDDTEGRRHQKFIVQLNSGLTLLIAHNIDIAPRISSLSIGDHIIFYGEYEWNAKGGVVHWTHHDPRGRHEGGYLKHGEKIYQ